jgi:hypothetical protein
VFYNSFMLNVFLSPDRPFTISGRENSVLTLFDKLLFEDSNGGVFTGRNRLCSRFSSFGVLRFLVYLVFSVWCLVFPVFGSCLLVFGYFLVLVSCILYFFSRSTHCFFINPSKQPCLADTPLRSVVSVKKVFGHYNFGFTGKSSRPSVGESQSEGYLMHIFITELVTPRHDNSLSFSV